MMSWIAHSCLIQPAICHMYVCACVLGLRTTAALLQDDLQSLLATLSTILGSWGSISGIPGPASPDLT